MARSEFVRVQIELAASADEHSDRYWDGQLGSGPTNYQRRKYLRRRESELLDANFCNWVPLPWHQGSGCGCRRGSQASVEFTGCLLQSAVIRRGFVDEVRCKLADWAGEPTCSKCRGGGELVNGGKRPLKCPICHGTGRVGGVGPAVVRCQPVTFAKASDRKPNWRSSGRGRVWHWRLANKDAALPDVLAFSADLLPWEVYWLMPGALGDYSAEFPTEVAAMDALSAALIRLAKGEKSLY